MYEDEEIEKSSEDPVEVCSDKLTEKEREPVDELCEAETPEMPAIDHSERKCDYRRSERYRLKDTDDVVRSIESYYINPRYKDKDLTSYSVLYAVSDLSGANEELLEKDARGRVCYKIANTDSQLYASIYGNEREFVAVTFSGGYDSVLLVAESIRDGYNVVPIVVTYKQNNWANDVLIQTSLLQLRRKYPDRICRPDYPMSIENLNLDGITGYFIQPSLAFALAYISGDVKRKVKKIRLGFIQKDECISFMKEFEDLYYSAGRFIHPYDNSGLPPIEWPLIKVGKDEVRCRLDGLGLYNEISMCTCEQPVGHGLLSKNGGFFIYIENCESCMSCHAFRRVDEYRLSRKIAIYTEEFSEVLGLNPESTIERVDGDKYK